MLRELRYRWRGPMHKTLQVPAQGEAVDADANSLH